MCRIINLQEMEVLEIQIENESKKKFKSPNFSATLNLIHLKDFGVVASIKVQVPS